MEYIQNKDQAYKMLKELVNYNKNIKIDMYMITSMETYHTIADIIDEINKKLDSVTEYMVEKWALEKVEPVINLFQKLIESIKSSNETDETKEELLSLFEDHEQYLTNICDFYRGIKKTPPTTPTPKVKVEEEESEIFDDEEDEDEYDDMDLINEFTTRKELKQMNYQDIFDTDTLKTKGDLIEYRNGLIEQSKNFSTMNPLKKQILSKSIVTTYVYEDYFNYFYRMAEKYGIKNVFKFKGKLPFKELSKLRYKEKATRLESTKKYTHDNGIVYFWVFKDAIVFKTI